jgi:hypothetical protein
MGEDLTDFGQDDFDWFVVEGIGANLQVTSVLDHRCMDGRLAYGSVNDGRSDGTQCQALEPVAFVGAGFPRPTRIPCQRRWSPGRAGRLRPYVVRKSSYVCGATKPQADRGRLLASREVTARSTASGGRCGHGKRENCNQGDQSAEVDWRWIEVELDQVISGRDQDRAECKIGPI